MLEEAGHVGLVFRSAAEKIVTDDGHTGKRFPEQRKHVSARMSCEKIPAQEKDGMHGFKLQLSDGLLPDLRLVFQLWQL